MLPGPVFNVELVTTARRARYYAIRFTYGMILLFFVVQTVGQWSGDGNALWEGSALSIAEMAATGQRLFAMLTVFQGVAVVALTPAIVAGVVADEKQRRTLQYMMASRLSSAEIILGKLFARMLHVSIFLAIGLPVMSLISLFGGVDPVAVVLMYAGTLSTAWFLAALAILVSTLARRPREATAQVYVLGLAWLFGPALVAQLMPGGGRGWLQIYEWISPVNDVLRWSSPYTFVEGSFRQNVVETFVWMVSLQSSFACLFVVLAIALLRPVVRREGDGPGRRGRLATALGVRRFLPRPGVGDDPMLWKECHVARTRGVIRYMIGFVFLVLGVVLSYTTMLTAVPAFVELWNHGYTTAEAYDARRAFNVYLRVVCTLLYVAWGLGVASLAAAGVVGEREEDTWTSLTTTPLSGEEILRAKMYGPVWATRWFGLLLIVLWLLGLASGAVHPLGLVAVIETAVFLWFVAALGVSFSLSSKTSARAQLATIATLVVLNGLYLLCCIPMRPNTMFIAIAITPMIEALSLLSYDEVASFYSNLNHANEVEAVMTCTVGVLLYGAAALVITTHVFATFDVRIDRPRRGWDQPPIPDKEVRFIDDDDGS